MSKSNSARRNAIHVVGHPGAPIGMGEHARSVFHALRVAGEPAYLVDIYGSAGVVDQALISSYAEYLSPTLCDGINLFCINADEVEQAFQTLRDRNLLAPGSRNIIYPAWELSRFPEVWGQILNGFDEVWSPSKFITDAVRPSTTTKVVDMPLACEIGQRALLSRRHFQIPDSSYCFLFAFDFLSYLERKNPTAVLEAFKLAVAERPNADVRLVIKLNNSQRVPTEFSAFKQQFAKFSDKVIIIDGTISDLEMKALIWLSDCFISLHRSEGFGRGISESMVLGKPTIATGYSGNLDFCTHETSFLVPFRLIPLGAGQYPHWQDQVWADADPRAAARYMVNLIDDPALGWEKGARARQFMAAEFSFLKRGLAYASRCRELLGQG